MLHPESDEESEHILFVHIELPTEILDEEHIVVLCGILGEYLGKSYFARVETDIPVAKLIMVEFIVVEGLNEGTHLIEDPDLLLECNSVDVVSEADVLQHL